LNSRFNYVSIARARQEAIYFTNEMTKPYRDLAPMSRRLLRSGFLCLRLGLLVRFMVVTLHHAGKVGFYIEVLGKFVKHYELREVVIADWAEQSVLHPLCVCHDMNLTGGWPTFQYHFRKMDASDLDFETWNLCGPSTHLFPSRRLSGSWPRDHRFVPLQTPMSAGALLGLR
jgi:hypothetical protein